MSWVSTPNKRSTNMDMLQDCPQCEAIECLIDGKCYWCDYDTNKRGSIMPVPVIKQTHLLFVYGTLKKHFGGKAHDMYLHGRDMRGVCATKGVMVHLGGYPGLVPDDVCQVTGEVYEVDPVDIQSMDAYEGVPHNYTRKLIETPWGRAWCYFKNHIGSPIADNLVCVDRGVWTGGKDDKAPYRQVRDFYANKRWLQPEYRNMPVQPIVPTTTPESSPASTPTPQPNNVVPLPVKVVQPSIMVGPGTEMM